MYMLPEETTETCIFIKDSKPFNGSEL